MSRLRRMVAGIPGSRTLWRSLRSVPGMLHGLPPISYSPVSTELIRASLGREDPTILEIGCNKCTVTEWFLKMFECPRIYCFEPDPRAIARFKARISERPNVTLFEIALSDREGSIDFYQSGGYPNELLVDSMPQGWDLSGSIKQPHRHLAKHPWVTFDKKISVPTTTLDAVCETHDIGPIDFIWMDVQGAEMEVLRGAVQTLTKTRFLYTEYSDHELYKGQPRLHGLVKSLGDFRVVKRYPDDALLRNESLTPKLSPDSRRRRADS